ncbi:MAG TPA: PIN domain-containing protein [Solirubrobacterales bacterium]|nr:PIN domain-containing protein [Solirubrobacterales bacterium]
MIFADTSFLVAAVDDRDQHYEAARQLLQKTSDRRIVTTNQVRGETWTTLRRKLWHGKAVEFLDSIGGEGQRIGVARVSEELEIEALDWLRRHDEREYSFVDATSFAYMRARRITEALAFDGDFAAAGFPELRP